MPRYVAYVGSRTTRERGATGTGIAVFDVSEDFKDWTLLQQLALTNPTYLLLGPSKTSLYVVEGDGDRIHTFGISQKDATLDHRAETFSGGTNPVHLALSPDDRFVVVANHNSGTVAALPIEASGKLGEPCSIVTLVGETGPHRTMQTGSRPHQIVWGPDATSILVPDKGLDVIHALELDRHGTLAVGNDATRLREMSGPRHLALDPQTGSAYSVDELRSTVTGYRWDPVSNRLVPRQVVSSLPSSIVGDSRAAAIAFDRATRTIFVSNRGGAGDSTPGGEWPDSIGAFPIDSEGLLLQPAWTRTIGTRPRFICLTPDLSHVVVAHEKGNSIAIHQISSLDRRLPAGHLVAHIGSPVCVVIDELRERTSRAASSL